MVNDNTAQPGTAGLVTEDDIARMTGLDVSQVRLMMSGNVPIPAHLEGVIPAPATEITGYVWRAEDVQGLQQRLAEAKERQRQEIAEQLRASTEATAAGPAGWDEPATRVSESVFEFQENREQRRRDAEEKFGGDVDEVSDALLPATTRKRKPGWLTGIKSAWNSARAESVQVAPAQVEDVAPDQAAPEAFVGEDGNTVVTTGANSRRTRSSSRKPTRARRGAAPTTASPDTDETVTDSAAASVDETGEVVDAGMDRAAKAAAKRAEKAAAKEAKAAEAAIKKQNRDLAKGVERKPKLTAEERKQKKAEEAAAKREDRAASKAAKVARATAYKEAMVRWKQDVAIAKETGTRPPRRPKRPKNDTSKPKPVDVTNAVRALATMLENSPGELESIRVMAKEYEGTQIGEAFRRIQYRVSDQNASLVEAFAPEKVFPTEVHNMLAVGQKTIAPGPALRTAVKLMDAGTDAKRKLIGEIMEPASVGLLSLAALFATAYGVMPSFVEMYNSLDMEVPPVSAAILAMSDWTVWILGGAFIATALYFLWWFAFGRTWDKWRTALDAYSLHMPLMGTANMTQQTYQLLKVLGAYINVGAPEREALVDAAAATKNRAIRKHLLSTAELMMAGRRTFADTFDTDMFPSMAKNILGIGEAAGRVPEAILDLEVVYEREAEVAAEQAVRRVSGTVAGISSLIFTVVVTMVTVPPLEMFGSTLSYGQ